MPMLARFTERRGIMEPDEMKKKYNKCNEIAGKKIGLPEPRSHENSRFKQ
jgi:hypothetical protein